MIEWAKILKANPYHDERGRFSSEENAKFVSIGGVFAKQKAKTKEPETNTDLSADEKKTLEKELYSRSGGPMGRTTISTNMFKGENPYGNVMGAEDKHYKVKEVDISALAATQLDVDVAGVRAYGNGKGNMGKALPKVVNHKGTMIIMDGTHRLAALALAGRKKAKVLMATTTGELEKKNWLNYGKFID